VRLDPVAEGKIAVRPPPASTRCCQRQPLLFRSSALHAVAKIRCIRAWAGLSNTSALTRQWKTARRTTSAVANPSYDQKTCKAKLPSFSGEPRRRHYSAAMCVMFGRCAYKAPSRFAQIPNAMHLCDQADAAGLRFRDNGRPSRSHNRTRRSQMLWDGSHSRDRPRADVALLGADRQTRCRRPDIPRPQPLDAPRSDRRRASRVVQPTERRYVWFGLTELRTARHLRWGKPVRCGPYRTRRTANSGSRLDSRSQLHLPASAVENGAVHRSRI